MEVILSDKRDIFVSIKAMRLYLEKMGINGYLYVWTDDYYATEDTECDRIDEGDEQKWDAEPSYFVTSKDLGKSALYHDILDNLLLFSDSLDRTDELLISVLKDIGRDSCVGNSLSIATVPDGVEWHIKRQGSCEWVEEGNGCPKRWHGVPI